MMFFLVVVCYSNDWQLWQYDLLAVLQQLTTQTKPRETSSVQSSLPGDCQRGFRLHWCVFCFNYLKLNGFFLCVCHCTVTSSLVFHAHKCALSTGNVFHKIQHSTHTESIYACMSCLFSFSFIKMTSPCAAVFQAIAAKRLRMRRSWSLWNWCGPNVGDIPPTLLW